jgi:hypothetical protein
MIRWRSRRYYQLVCSLPALPKRFDAGKLPISPERLQSRLKMLHPDDAREIQHLRDILAWSEKFAETSDAIVVKRYRELMGRFKEPLAREVAATAVDARMIVNALRRRRRKLGPPEIGMGQWYHHVRRHFDEPDFRLGHVFPRLPELRRLLEEGDAIGFQRGLIDATWAWLRKRASERLFSFEAVVLYVARWELMHYWQRMEAERGRAIFESLVAEALGKYEHAYA